LAIWSFFDLDENSIYFGLFWQNFYKKYKIFCYSKIYLIYFGKFSLKIWPFFTFENLAFLETTNGQIWPFYFLGPGNPEQMVKVE
jgi:hypothetical protein